ncbi:murein hydrolase activator EnvC family protein [Amycolatopsis jejuensis]|uniref:murein hydrolase activator EnvC family protein n=1 Tax=Amycolatopsis jejuensis TaxID=330084 RepID=UPI001FDF3D12|nr:M23 family metallopeptidase [Amycolatopsis jejuensis]
MRLAGAGGEVVHPLFGPDSRRGAIRTWLIFATILLLFGWPLTVLSTRANAAEPPAPPPTAASPSPPTPGPTAASPSQAGRLAWPLTPRPPVTRTFEPPATPYGPGHRGVDLDAAAGQQVLAADMGVVVFAGQVAGQGVVALDHDGGLHTTYLPITPSVAPGDQVYRGQVLGTTVAGHPGCPATVCLHWGARRGTEYIDPLALVGTPSRVRLKPWADGP